MNSLRLSGAMRLIDECGRAEQPISPVEGVFHKHTVAVRRHLIF